MDILSLGDQQEQDDATFTPLETTSDATAVACQQHPNERASPFDMVDEMDNSGDSSALINGAELASDSARKSDQDLIREWREKQERELAERDALEQKKIAEMKAQAKKELEDWYKQYEAQVEKTRARQSINQGSAYQANMEPGTEWARVNDLIDFNAAKKGGSSTDMARMRSILLHLKENPKPASLPTK